ncbi:hypothetical protein PVL29_003364 [Vitis rotundifolia]|uniref:Reverse transcriptase zinc-binding domain-containing protein n=1 Tax=Vitis rotundifolia TaxID=103349 RepID=A0AA39AF63_VITRO|nr:hypothetical protein PVL29_003364 [Vitis rotundifolia]
MLVDLEDRMLWKETKSGEFSVKSLYGALETRNATLFSWNIMWNLFVSSKGGFFTWEASWGKVLTLDQLKRRGWIVANRCFLCPVEEESIDHFLIHCSKAKVLWELIFALFGVTWVLPSSVKETLLGWNGSFVGKKHQKVWKVAPLCLFWTIWKERNRITFENEEFLVQKLKISFICNYWSWAKLFIDVGLLSLINHFDWLGSK